MILEAQELEPISVNLKTAEKLTGLGKWSLIGSIRSGDLVISKPTGKKGTILILWDSLKKHVASGVVEVPKI